MTFFASLIPVFASHVVLVGSAEWNADFVSNNAATLLQIQHVQAKCDFIALDNGLNEYYIKFLE